MKVLHIGKYFEPFKGGVETYLRDLLHGLSLRGVQCVALVHNHERSLRTCRERSGEGPQAPGVWRVGTWFRILFAPISPTFGLALAHLLREFEPDIVHVHLPNPSALWVLALPRARRRPLVVHWHSDVITDALGPVMKLVYAAYRPLERAMLRRASLIVATSRSYLETSASLSAFPERSRVIPLGLDAGRLTDLARMGESAAPAHGGADLQVLAIGRLTYYKGFGYLIEAAARVPGVQVHIVGHGERRWELRRLAAQLGVHERVTFHGSLDDAGLAGQLARCDCLCLPSVERTEAFGLVLLEAMFFGKPTVITDVPGSGMSSVVVADETGLVVPPRSAAALAQALERLRDDPALRARLGAAGRERFERSYSIGHSADALAAAYRGLAEGPDTPGGGR